MAGEVLVIGLGVVAFIMFYFSSTLEKEHVFLKLLTIFFGIFFILLIPKVAIDNHDYCEVVKINETVSGNLTTNGYDRLCYDNTSTTDNRFFWLAGSYFAIFVIYCFLYFGNDVLTQIAKFFGKKP